METTEETALEFKEVSKYAGEKTLLHRVSFTLQQGKVLGILGTAGSGKSTIFNFICGLDEPSSGHVLIKGHNSEFAGKELKKIIGMVPQVDSFYSDLSVTDNLAFFGSLYGLKGQDLQERIEETLTFTQMKTRAHLVAETLSVGLKRRLNLACALLHRPFLVIADDPVQGCDDQSREFILSCFHSLAKTRGVTIVYVGDFQPELENMLDRVLLLHEGKILADDTIVHLIRELEGGLINLVLDYAGTETLERLEEAPFVKDVKRGDDNSFIIKTSNAQKALVAIVHALQNLESDIREIKVLKPNFESVFLHMTWGRVSNRPV